MERDASPIHDTASGSDTASASATVAFIDLAGFSAIADVYGDESAIAVLEIFEGMVREALSAYAPPIKWIGDEAMLSFPEPESAIQALGTLLQACRKEPRLPLTRTALNHGPVVRRAGDLFGSTVNIASRIAALAAPRSVACHATHRRRGRGQGHSGARSRKGGAAIGGGRSRSLRDRACAVARPGLDRSRLQDACALCIVSAGRARRAVVLLAALRGSLSEIAADLSVGEVMAVQTRHCVFSSRNSVTNCCGRRYFDGALYPMKRAMSPVKALQL